MRLRLRRNRVTKKRELVLRPRKVMTLNMAQVRWLEEAQAGSLLPLCYEASCNATTRTLAYDVDGYMSLKRFVRSHGLSAGMLLGMAADVERVVSLCVRSGYSYLSVLFDERYVFVGTGARLHFAFLPLNGLRPESKNSPLSILGCLGDARRLRLDSPNATDLCERLAEFVLGEQGIFSPNDLRDFLRVAREGDCMADDAMGSVAPADSMRIERERMRRARLPNASLVLRSLRHGFTYPLEANRLETVGRGRECTVSLDGMARISRKHASVCVGERKVVLTDLGSTNGTYVDGCRLEPSKGYEIELGQTFLLADEPFCVAGKVGK